MFLIFLKIAIFVVAFFLLGLFLISFIASRKIIKTFLVKPKRTVSGPLVSAIIPSFNEENYLPNCIKSIRNQTYKNIEIIVVDNGSVDKTKEVAEDLGAKVIEIKEKNLPIVRNEGAKIARGDTFFFIDADSILENSYIENLKNALSDRILLSHGAICCYDSLLHNFLWIFNRLFKPHFYTSGRNGVCLKAKTFWEIGGYDKNHNPEKGFREDLDLGLRVGRKFGFSSIKYCFNSLIGSSARREKKFGYPFWKFPAPWKEGVRGVRGEKIVN